MISNVVEKIVHSLNVVKKYKKIQICTVDGNFIDGMA